MRKSKKSQSGFGLIESALLLGLVAILATLMGSRMNCLLKQAFPIVSLNGDTKTALCRSTEAVNYTRFVFIFVGLGTPAFLWVRNRTGRRRG
jgi:hypothetical protein